MAYDGSQSGLRPYAVFPGYVFSKVCAPLEEVNSRTSYRFEKLETLILDARLAGITYPHSFQPLPS